MRAGIEPERGTAQHAEPNQLLHLTRRALDSSGSLRPAPKAVDISKTRSFLVGNGKAWLLIAADALTGLVAGAGLGRHVLNVPTTPAGSASPATQDNLCSRDRTRLRRNASFLSLKKAKSSWRDFAPDFALKTRTTAAAE